jgi:hypothetical protein
MNLYFMPVVCPDETQYLLTWLKLSFTVHAVEHAQAVTT